ncbi:MAG: formyltransferase family protein [Phycisphaerae bacterium]|mgnify:CR=1 FL=1|nr:formyltransferase family protein [Phycisphaerae bacterium]
MSARAPLRVGALISGGGRTVLNLADRIDSGSLPATLALVIAHRADVPGIARCAARGVPTAVIPGGPSCDDRIDAALADARVELVALCGYLRHFRVAPRWAGRTINIHPSLLPAFGGKGMYGDRVHAAVLAAVRAGGPAETGCTVHAVDDVYDRGPVLLQRRCRVEPGDDPHTLAARVFALETDALPEVVRRIAIGEVPLPLPHDVRALAGSIEP